MKSMQKNIIISVIITLIVAGGLGFYGGDVYGASHAASAAKGAFGGAGRSGFTRGAAGGSAVSGSILSQDANSLTVSTTGGSSKIVFVSASTTVLKTTSGSMSDLSTGTNITVIGTSNSDGSVTATSIQVRPARALGQTGPTTN